MRSEKLELLGENLDRLVTIDVGGRGVINILYEATRRVFGEPLTYRIAKELKERVGKDDIVLIVTGFRVPPTYVQETDGPLGAAVLARMFSLGFEAIPIIITDQDSQSIEIVKAACLGVGLNVRNVDELVKNRVKRSVAIIDFPIDDNEAKRRSKEVIDQLNPKAIIFIEKVGKNIKGEYHTMRGLNVSAYHSKVDYLVDEAKKKNILTVGIGDGGNEIGMGIIEETVRKYVPYGDKCQCPCQGGIAAHTKTDVLLVATVSNWGAYAISAMLAKMLNKPEILHKPHQEDLMLTLVVSKGAIDGVTGLVEKSVDGLDLEIHMSIVKIMHEMIRKY